IPAGLKEKIKQLYLKTSTPLEISLLPSIFASIHQISTSFCRDSRFLVYKPKVDDPKAYVVFTEKKYLVGVGNSKMVFSGFHYPSLEPIVGCLSQAELREEAQILDRIKRGGRSRGVIQLLADYFSSNPLQDRFLSLFIFPQANQNTLEHLLEENMLT